MLDWLPTRPQRRLTLWLGWWCDRGARRKLHLFAAACCARIARGVPSAGDRELIDTTLLGLGWIDGDEFEAALWSRGVFNAAAVTPEEWAGRWADIAARCVAWRETFAGGRLDWPAFKRTRREERKVQADLLRCVFGNPFRPGPALDPAWLDAEGRAARTLARSIDAAGAFGHLPSLADALDAAGCPDPALAAHCRAEGEHARGCWVLESLTGGGARRTVRVSADPRDAGAYWRPGVTRLPDGGRRAGGDPADALPVPAPKQARAITASPRLR
jgi:hypothetical protein